MADNPPKPERKTKALSTIQDRLHTEKAEKKNLQQELRKLENKLEQTRANLIEITAAVRQNTQTLASLESRIDDLIAEKNSLTRELQDEHGTIANLILALQRMRRIPPEAMIARPGAPLETAQTALVLKSTLPAVQNKANTLSEKLARLQEIETDLQQSRQDVIATSKQLEQEKEQMAALMAQRKTLFQRKQKDFDETSRNIARLAKEAKTLQDLIKKIEEENKRARTRAASRKAILQGRHASMPRTGKARVPVSGILTSRFGERDNIGAVSQGITIEARPGAIAVAPMGGRIMFASDFKNYGRMIIIQHEGRYHSLIAGLERIDADAGQAVKAGEPIGLLPLTSSRGGRPKLYYELRRKGSPVDPARKIAGLES